MMLPLIVISVMPTAMQPTEDIAVVIAYRLGAAKKPGVANAAAASINTTPILMPQSTCSSELRVARGGLNESGCDTEADALMSRRPWDA
jgi:hypothetical protein